MRTPRSPALGPRLQERKDPFADTDGVVSTFDDTLEQRLEAQGAIARDVALCIGLVVARVILPRPGLRIRSDTR